MAGGIASPGSAGALWGEAPSDRESGAQAMATPNVASAFADAGSQLSAAVPNVANGLYGNWMFDFMSSAFDRVLLRRAAHSSHKRC
jgi:hypothetical protein